MTPRQAAYKKYLESDHWKELRSSALKRDGEMCVVCGKGGRLQVHHKVYRTPWESGVLEDVETLCKSCHSAEHGFFEVETTEFDLACEAIKKILNRVERPAVADWRRLKQSMTGHFLEVEPFSELMIWYVRTLAWMRYPNEILKSDHPMMELAFRVRDSIRKRDETLG